LSKEPEILVYFSIAAKDQTDNDTLSKNLQQFKLAGLDCDPVEISEKAGIKLTKTAPPPMPQELDDNGKPIKQSPVAQPKPEETEVPIQKPTVRGLGPDERTVGLEQPASGDDLATGRVRSDPDAKGPGWEGPQPTSSMLSPTPRPGQGRVANRKTPVTKKTQKAVRDAFASDLESLQNRVNAIAEIEDDDLRNHKLKELSAALPKILKDLNKSPAAAEALNDGAITELINGLTHG